MTTPPPVSGVSAIVLRALATCSVVLAAPIPAVARAVPADALRVLRVSPAAGTSEVPRATPVVIFFDRPVVSLTGLESPAAAPARLDPSTPGHGRWLNT